MSGTTTGYKAALKLGKVSRVMLFVRDFDASVKFYTEVLGIPLLYKQGNWAALATDGVEINLHGDRTAAAPEHGDPSIGFCVEDFDAAYAALQERGVKVGKIFSPAPGLRVANFEDLDGNELGIEGK